MMVYRCKTVIDNRVHEVVIKSARTLREAMHAFEQHLYDDLCIDFGVKIPLWVDLVEIND